MEPSRKQMKRGGRKRHAAWPGYTELEDGRAECKYCKYAYTKIDFHTMNNHTNRCEKNPFRTVDKKSKTKGKSNVESVASDALTTKRRSVEDLPPNNTDNSRRDLPSQKIVDKARKDDALIKFFLRFGICVDNLDSIHLKTFVEVFDNMYEIPCAENFLNVLVPKALDQIVKINAEAKSTNIMYVQCTMADPGCLLASFLMTLENDYIGVCCQRIDRRLDIPSFDEFCQYAVGKCEQLYSVLVSYIIHNMSFDCPPIQYSKKHAVQYLRSLSPLLRSLKNEFIPVENEDEDSNEDAREKTDEEILNEQCLAILNNLADKIRDVQFVGLAIPYFLDLLNDDRFNGNNNVSELINNFFQPIHFACQFVLPKYRMDKIEQPMQAEVNRFMLMQLGNLEAMSDYVNESGKFRELFQSPGIIDNPIEFWQFAMLKGPQEKKISRVSLNLLNIPAIPKFVNLSGMIDVYDPSWDDDEISRNLGFLLFLEDQ